MCILHAPNNTERRGFPNLSLSPSWTGSDRSMRYNAAAFESKMLDEKKDTEEDRDKETLAMSGQVKGRRWTIRHLVK